MNKPFKRFVSLGLTISLASVPTLNEVSKANEVSQIQQEGISLLSTEIDEAMQSVKVDQLSMDDFALTIMEQPDIVDLEVMEDLPDHQQAIREDAEDYLKDIKPELIDLNERSILVAEYMSLYNDYFVSEIEKVQEKTSSEQEARQNIEAGLQELNAIIEKEQAEINDTQKEIEAFLVNLEEDFKDFEASVTEAEEYVIEQEGYVAEEVTELVDEYTTLSEKKNGINYNLIAIFSSVAALTGIMFGGLVYLSHAKNTLIRAFAYGSGVTIVSGGLSLLLLSAPGHLTTVKDIEEKSEGLAGLQSDLFTVSAIGIQANSLFETTSKVTTSLDNITNEWDVLQSNIHTMADVMGSEDLYDLQPQFEEASIAWENTQNVSEAYQQLEENTSDPVEIDLDEIDTEEEYQEALKEAYDVDELIDISELTEEELEDFFLDLMEEGLEEAS